MMRKAWWMGRIALVVAVVAMLAAGCAAAEQAAIAIGPYVQNVSTDNATICWATVSGRVSYAAAEGEPTTLNEYEHHALVLRGLQPGTTYGYDLLGDGSDAGRGTFTTVPEGEHPFTFAVLADTQGRDNPAHGPLVARMLAEKPDLVVNVGDLVSNGWDILDWERFFEVNAELMRSIAYHAVLGNHERDAPVYFDFFALPGNERYYSFDRGSAHFVVLDSPGPYLPPSNQALTAEDRARYGAAREEYWRRQLEWLKEDLEAHQEAKYVFAFFHYPMYSVLASRTGGAQQMRERFGTVFQDYRVSAVFSGHDHHYHRAAAGGVQFVVAGASGGHPRPTDAPQPESVRYASAATLVRVEVGAERATVRVADVDGNAVDEFELQPRLPSAREPAAAQGHTIQ